MTYHVTYARPGEPPCRVGSDEGFADLEAASTFMRYMCKGEWSGKVQIVDSEGVVIESVTAGTDA